MAYIKNVGRNMFVEVKGNSLTVSGKYTEKSGTIFQQGSKSLEVNSSQRIFSDGHGMKEEPQKIAYKNNRTAHVFFVGGAGDKREYLGSGPNRNVVTAQNHLNGAVNSLGLGSRFNSTHLGFYEIEPEQNVTNNILNTISNKSDPVYIIGHSLGGWNSVYAASIISKNGYNIRMLITLDPVGTRNGVHIISELYEPNEQGLYKGKNYRWYNVKCSAKKGNFSDFVAFVGGQANVVSGEFGGADSTITVNENHLNAGRLFAGKYYKNNKVSLSDIVANDIDKQLNF